MRTPEHARTRTDDAVALTNLRQLLPPSAAPTGLLLVVAAARKRKRGSRARMATTGNSRELPRRGHSWSGLEGVESASVKSCSTLGIASPASPARSIPGRASSPASSEDAVGHSPRTSIVSVTSSDSRRGGDRRERCLGIGCRRRLVANLPVPEDPTLGMVAEQLEAQRHVAEVWDVEWRLAYLTSEYVLAAGAGMGLEATGLGTPVFSTEALAARDAWPAGPTAESFIDNLMTLASGDRSRLTRRRSRTACRSGRCAREPTGKRDGDRAAPSTGVADRCEVR